MAVIVGKKLGMTRVFLDDGSAVPVTVIEAAPNKVTAIRKADRDGYDAVQLAAIPVAEDRLTKAEAGHLKKAGAAGLKTLVEFRDAEISASKEVDTPAAGGDQEASGDEDAAGEEASSGGEAVKVGDEVDWITASYIRARRKMRKGAARRSDRHENADGSSSEGPLS